MVFGLSDSPARLDSVPGNHGDHPGRRLRLIWSLSKRADVQSGVQTPGLSRILVSLRIDLMKPIVTLLLSIILMGFANSASAAGKLHHVVCFKFKSTATTEQIKQVEEAFAALQEKVPGIESLKWGTNVSKEQRNKGFTHCFILTFKTQKDCDTYLEHPEHKAFAKLVGPVVDDVFVMDFVPQKK